MLKVMVVDDEENIRLGIVEGIDWGSYGLEVVCQAENGREALELSQRHRPDIILLDINMPFVNGVEFSKQARKFLPHSRIIILSGYSDFEYAKESIKYGVSEYLLKPVSPGELMEAIVKARDMLTESIRKEQYLSGLKQRFLESIPALREKWVYDLLHATYLDHSEKAIKKKLEWLGIDFPSDKFAACVIRIEDLAERSSGKEEDKHLFLYAVKNICDEILSRNAFGLSVVTNEGLLEALISLESGDTCSYLGELDLKSETIEKSIEEFLGLTVTVRFGSVYSGYSQIAYSYKEAYCSVQLQRPDREEGESVARDKTASVLALVFPYDKEQELVRHLKAMNDKALKVAADLLDEIEANDLIAGDPDYLAAAASQIMRTVRRLLADSEIPEDNEERLNESAGPAGSFKIEDPSEIKATLIRYVAGALQRIIKTKGKPFRIEIEQVKSFIEENYDKDISLKDISSRIFMNPNYLCTLFKNEVGETINNYMTRVRMEQAMKLLRETDLKVFEIAERVGYSNTNYFSYTFKKYTGQAPVEYR
jgi:two-component system response regulator YesN